MEDRYENILLGIKSLLGITEENTTWDFDLLMYINTAISMLYDIGFVDLDTAKKVDDKSKWSDLVQDYTVFEDVKTYIYLRVKLLFDPPISSSVESNYKELLKELEWRICNRKELG